MGKCLNISNFELSSIADPFDCFGLLLNNWGVYLKHSKEFFDELDYCHSFIDCSDVILYKFKSSL